MKINKKNILIGIVGGVVLSGTIALASNLVYGDVFYNPFRIVVNNKAYEPKLPIINYMERTYVPLRELATITGCDVDFKDEIIYVNNSGIENEITVDFTKKVIERFAADFEHKIILEEDIPQINGIDRNIAEKIEKDLISLYMYENGSEASYPDTDQFCDYEFTENLTNNYLSNDIIGFEYELCGSRGGVSWLDMSGHMFSLKDGNEIKMKDLIKDNEKFIKVCQDETYRQLSLDKRIEDVTENIASGDFTQVEQKFKETIVGYCDNAYLTKKGVKIVIGKYEIGCGASGIFEFVVPYSLLEGTLKI